MDDLDPLERQMLGVLRDSLRITEDKLQTVLRNLRVLLMALVLGFVIAFRFSEGGWSFVALSTSIGIAFGSYWFIREALHDARMARFDLERRLPSLDG